MQRFAVLAGLSLSPAIAAADPVRGAVDVGTNFPMDLSVRGSIEGPHRLRASMSFGVLPGPYVDTINGFLLAINAYPRSTGDLLRAALKNSLSWRTHAGWRPFPALGFYGELGYGLVALGGDATAAEIIAGVTGQPVPSEVMGRASFEVGSMLHMFDLELGWEWILLRHLHLRAALGAALTFAAQTRIGLARGAREGPAVRAFSTYGERYLDDIYRKYVFTPVLSVSAGYAF